MRPDCLGKSCAAVHGTTVEHLKKRLALSRGSQRPKVQAEKHKTAPPNTKQKRNMSGGKLID